MNISRRKFVKQLSLFGAFVGVPGMMSSCLRSEDGPDIKLTSNTKDLARTVKEQFGKLEDMARNVGKSISIGLSDEEIVHMSIEEGDIAKRYLKLQKESTGETANLTFGLDGAYPVISLVDSKGNVISKNNETLEYSFRDFEDGSNPGEWFELGIKIAAYAFAIWIGLSIAKGIFAALAFLAFNAMVLGLIVASVAFLSGMFELAGWDFDYIRNLFERAIDEISLFLNEVISFINQF